MHFSCEMLNRLHDVFRQFKVSESKISCKEKAAKFMIALRLPFVRSHWAVKQLATTDESVILVVR